LRTEAYASRPLIGIDIHIEVPAVAIDDLSRAQGGERSSDIRKRVERARAKMVERQEKANSKLTSAEIERYCSLGTGAAAILQSAITKLGLSARGYHRILKVARTIADLVGANEITAYTSRKQFSIAGSIARRGRASPQCLFGRTPEAPSVLGSLFEQRGTSGGLARLSI